MNLQQKINEGQRALKEFAPTVIPHARKLNGALQSLHPFAPPEIRPRLRKLTDTVQKAVDAAERLSSPKPDQKLQRKPRIVGDDAVRIRPVPDVPAYIPATPSPLPVWVLDPVDLETCRFHISHYRPEHDGKVYQRGGSTIAALVDQHGDPVWMHMKEDPDVRVTVRAIAICREDEMFNRKLGRTIATGRLRKLIGQCEVANHPG